MKPPDLADVTLLLEGTYPIVRGGVSQWVHDLITGLPELSFALVYLGALKGEPEPLRYALPTNVVRLTRHYLMEPSRCGKPRARQGDARYFEHCEKLHAWFRDPEGDAAPAWLDTVLLQKDRQDGAGERDFFYSERAWAQILRSYEESCPEESFLDYFWAVRSMHVPLMNLSTIARLIGPSRLYHAVTTGYAGLLGAMLKQSTGRPFLLTEHGIYTKERNIDLQAQFLQCPSDPMTGGVGGNATHRNAIWTRLFEGIGRLAYGAADDVITLFEQNRRRQISDGAPPERTRIVPNGVDVARYAPLRSKRPTEVPCVIGFIGRIVPIKDLKTFIRAIGVLAKRLPNVEGWIAGPQEEDPAYVDNCKALVRSLQLESHIRFLGFQKPDDILPKFGVLMLTSISEAFPLVIGESHASGLPVVATDVGACRELIEGRDAPDRALGRAGEVVPIADHAALAQAAFGLLTDPQRWHTAQQAGIVRVERYYRQSRVLDTYRELYARRSAA